MTRKPTVTSRISKRLTRYFQRFIIDAYIISFPKSGRTWLRVMIGKALCLKYDLPDDIMLDTPKITSAAGILRTEFIHDYADNTWREYSQLPTNKRRYAKKRVVFLVRNIKDVLVSYYFHSTKRTGDFSGDISAFVRSERFGARKVITFYNIWHENLTVPLHFLLLRYEE
ncbi:MAG: sulfotransferase domain-containing protein, partial [Thiogranum sp.]